MNDPDDMSTEEKLNTLRNPVEYRRAGDAEEGLDRGTAIVKNDGKYVKVDLTDGSVMEIGENESYGDYYTTA